MDSIIYISKSFVVSAVLQADHDLREETNCCACDSSLLQRIFSDREIAFPICNQRHYNLENIYFLSYVTYTHLLQLTNEILKKKPANCSIPHITAKWKELLLPRLPDYKWPWKFIFRILFGSFTFEENTVGIQSVYVRASSFLILCIMVSGFMYWTKILHLLYVMVLQGSPGACLQCT